MGRGSDQRGRAGDCRGRGRYCRGRGSDRRGRGTLIHPREAWNTSTTFSNIKSKIPSLDQTSSSQAYNFPPVFPKDKSLYPSFIFLFYLPLSLFNFSFSSFSLPSLSIFPFPWFSFPTGIPLTFFFSLSSFHPSTVSPVSLFSSFSSQSSLILSLSLFWSSILFSAFTTYTKFNICIIKRRFFSYTKNVIEIVLLTISLAFPFCIFFCSFISYSFYFPVDTADFHFRFPSSNRMILNFLVFSSKQPANQSKKKTVLLHYVAAHNINVTGRGCYLT